jgi:hypothetical protein
VLAGSLGADVERGIEEAARQIVLLEDFGSLGGALEHFVILLSEGGSNGGINIGGERGGTVLRPKGGEPRNRRNCQQSREKPQRRGVPVGDWRRNRGWPGGGLRVESGALWRE